MNYLVKKIKHTQLHIKYFVSEVMFFLSPVKRLKQRQTILSLKNKYCGKRCFIIGNGPSLKSEDLEILYLHNEISFAANYISKIFPQTNWRPTFYSVTDEGHQRRLIDVMSETGADFKIFRKKSYFWTRKVAGNCIWLNAIGNRKLLLHPLFSENILKNIYAIASVTYISIQIAVYLGFKNIYLIGVDNNYAKSINKDGIIREKRGVKSHFYSNDDIKENVCGAEWEMNIAYESAKSYADEHGICIYNATRGGNLEKFPRVDFDTLFPIYDL